jgi:hypothetical protein
MNPKARQEKLLVRQVGDDLIVYDQILHNAHSLNPAAAFLWRHCDGTTTPEELTERLGKELGQSVDERLTWLALDDLARCRLLNTSPTRPVTSRYSRRQLIREMGLRGAQIALVPAIISILAPMASAAGSFFCGGDCPCPLPCVCNTNKDGSTECH